MRTELIHPRPRSRRKPVYCPPSQEVKPQWERTCTGCHNGIAPTEDEIVVYQERKCIHRTCIYYAGKKVGIEVRDEIDNLGIAMEGIIACLKEDLKKGESQTQKEEMQGKLIYAQSLFKEIFL